MSNLSEKLKNLLLTNEQRVQFAFLDRIATALEVMAGLRPRTEQGEDESEVMESVDAVYAQQEVDELMKGRPEEED
ncbi:hypothetical protein LCGC14_2285010 [marine sediment metagenome]|uniref:Uncharacterized protein n=1 Tax=marine sediment metagenome TaxID=412755 RepID=A0A0F9F5H1_9ZZZZ